MNSGLNPDVVKTELDFVFFSEFDLDAQPGFATARDSMVFRQKSTGLGTVRTEEIEGPGAWESHQEEEERTLTSIRAANPKNHEIVNYKKTIPIPQEYFEDDQHDTINESVRKAGIRGRTTQDKFAFDVYVDGFGGNHTTSDGSSLWNNSHTAVNGDSIDNLETGTLTADNLEVLFVSLQTQPSQDGELGGHNPTFLLVPTGLFAEAQEVAKSELKAGTGNNDLNYFSQIYPGLQIFHNPYLTSTYNGATNADTSYYLGSGNHSICRFVRKDITTEMVPPATDLRDRWFYKARYREVVSAISWEGAVASNGTV